MLILRHVQCLDTSGRKAWSWSGRTVDRRAQCRVYVVIIERRDRAKQRWWCWNSRAPCVHSQGETTISWTAPRRRTNRNSLVHISLLWMLIHYIPTQPGSLASHHDIPHQFISSAGDDLAHLSDDDCPHSELLQITMQIRVCGGLWDLPHGSCQRLYNPDEICAGTRQNKKMFPTKTNIIRRTWMC